MANEYTSPFFGDRDMGQFFIPPADTTVAFTKRNRQSEIKYNDAGQVYAADVLCTHTWHGTWSERNIDRPNLYPGDVTKGNTTIQFTVDGEPERPWCVLAIPCTYGNVPKTATQYYQWVRPCVEEFNDIVAYYYILVGKTNGASMTIRRDNTNASGKPIVSYRVVQTGRVESTETGGLPLLTLFDPVTMIPTGAQSIGWIANGFNSGSNNFLNALNALNNADDNRSSRFQSEDLSIYNIDPAVVSRIAILTGAWAARPNNHLSEMRWINLTKNTFVDNVTQWTLYPPNLIGSFIATGLPVFTVDSFDQMVRYFEGDSWLADNDAPPPSDWSTDWDIYIKGAQRPDIYITMASPKVDEWLADLEDNTSGLSKDDIKVEYRYREYALNAVMDSPNPYANSYTTKDWLIDIYDDTRVTSYGENLQLNYPNVNNITGGLVAGGGGEFSDVAINELYPYYAELGFRIHYGKYMSAWCRYKIGVIGSPSVPDFVKMQNEGVQDDAWQDDSTVTLHYDELPPGYNPYPTPEFPPDINPPPDDTSPSPSQTGLGLLTTTYKVTPANAKALGRYFWGGNLWQEIKALNTSPIENVVGMVIMPIDIAGDTSTIVVGNVDTNVNGDKISLVPLYTLGSAQIKGRYESFLDYEPYTTIHIFLPFVGFVRLDPVYVTGKTLSVTYSYDIINGLCNAMLFVDGVYIESHQGQCGIDIPLIATNRSQLAVGLATSLLSTGEGAVTNIAMGNKAGAVSGTVSNVIGSLGEYLTGFHSQRQGGYTPVCAWTETRNCFLVIESPNASYTGTYRHDKGLPCNASHTIGSLSGFTVCDPSVDVSGIVGATEEEKAMIKEYLTTGFYA